jgi:hypothetical protein
MKQFGVTSLSPFLATYFNQQSVDKFDLVVAEPKTTPKSGIIFLHGSVEILLCSAGWLPKLDTR